MVITRSRPNVLGEPKWRPLPWVALGLGRHSISIHTSSLVIYKFMFTQYVLNCLKIRSFSIRFHTEADAFPVLITAVKFSGYWSQLSLVGLYSEVGGFVAYFIFILLRMIIRAQTWLYRHIHSEFCFHLKMKNMKWQMISCHKLRNSEHMRISQIWERRSIRDIIADIEFRWPQIIVIGITWNYQIEVEIY